MSKQLTSEQRCAIYLGLARKQTKKYRLGDWEMDLIVDSNQHIILTFVTVVQPPINRHLRRQSPHNGAPLRRNKMMQNKRDCPTNFPC